MGHPGRIRCILTIFIPTCIWKLKVDLILINQQLWKHFHDTFYKQRTRNMYADFWSDPLKCHKSARAHVSWLCNLGFKNINSALNCEQFPTKNSHDASNHVPNRFFSMDTLVWNPKMLQKRLAKMSTYCCLKTERIQKTFLKHCSFSSVLSYAKVFQNLALTL